MMIAHLTAPAPNGNLWPRHVQHISRFGTQHQYV